MKSLKIKLSELKRHRETLKREEDADKRASSQMEEEIKSLETILSRKTKQIEEGEVKLERYDEILKRSQDALVRLTENAKKLEEVIENELAALKS